jgi:hypothetical protein
MVYYKTTLQNLFEATEVKSGENFRRIAYLSAEN